MLYQTHDQLLINHHSSNISKLKMRPKRDQICGYG